MKTFGPDQVLLNHSLLRAANVFIIYEGPTATLAIKSGKSTQGKQNTECTIRKTQQEG